METTFKEKAVISTENLEKAANKIKEFAASKKLVITGEIPISIPKFDSKSKEKAFRNGLSRVLAHPTMKNCNMYLHSLGTKTKLDYCQREKDIQKARKFWIEARNKAEECRVKYKEEKGDFYKFRIA